MAHNSPFRSNRSGSSKTQRLVLWTMQALLLLLALPGFAQDLPDNDFIDWPIGECVDDRMVKSYSYKIQQDFANHWCPVHDNDVSDRCNDVTEVPGQIDFNCFHSGVDLHHLLGGDSTKGEVVYAAADGRVVGLLDWNLQGHVVLIEHKIRGETIYAAYAHLNQDIFVVENQPVRRGQPIGKIYTWAPSSNSHLHFEMRDRLQVTTCPRGTNCANENALTQSCFGNGYSLVEHPGGDTTCLRNSGPDALGSWGFRDPVEGYFADRPDYPLSLLAATAPTPASPAVSRPGVGRSTPSVSA